MEKRVKYVLTKLYNNGIIIIEKYEMNVLRNERFMILNDL